MRPRDRQRRARDIARRVLAWLAEPTAARTLGTSPYPDSVLVLEDGGRLGVLCLEIDEATQRRAVIEAKLNGYRRLVDEHPARWLLFVVPTRHRPAWLWAVARRVDEAVAVRGWVTSLAALRAKHLDASAVGLASGSAVPLRGILPTASTRGGHVPVGSEEWLQLLGEGGNEDFAEVLWQMWSGGVTRGRQQPCKVENAFARLGMWRRLARC